MKNFIVKTICYFVVYCLSTLTVLLIGSKGKAFVEPTTANFFAPLFLMVLFVPFVFVFKVNQVRIINHGKKILLASFGIGLLALILFFVQPLAKRALALISFFGFWIGFNLLCLIMVERKLSDFE